ncbi:zinc-binding dehydrogenase [Haladaptatus sp. F3-133]|jgi:NADPH:quinone reductase-like Zn-dependent oxidoreductase|uniref:Zinc-binding dehydrogenase n=1 Tax=Halorutilus salinus TaxID=2487751 RepID=A0A9Q4C3Q6_9EURY|nr:zinc-binding dehydrogenase [Halorutilus salinus]MCX2818537.1 zinc-binding dehydrogenase [Halorutilus salinus]
MKAVRFSEHGGRDVIGYGESEEPTRKEGEVLIDVKAAALNHLDVWTRRGLPGIDLNMPHVPGSDAAGVVVDGGATRFDEGDGVAVWSGVACGDCEFCRNGDEPLCTSFHIIGEHVEGVHAERVSVPAENLVRVPDDVDMKRAAAAPLVFGTAWRMLVTRAGLRPTENVLVLGASGGVGHACVQIARHAGATVYATAGSDEKAETARKLGAERVFDYTDENFADAVREATDGRGVDVVVDHVGKETWRDSLASLAKGGRLVTCGATTGGDATTDINRIFWNQLDVYGSTMATRGEVDDVLSLVWEGALEPRIRATLPMSEAKEGHRMLEERDGFGKVVLVPDTEL